MKQDKVIKAYKIIQKIEANQYPINVSYIFFTIKKALSPHWEFQIERERELFNKYHATIQENGDLKFEKQEDMAHFSEELADLADLDVDVNLKKPSISLSENINLSIEEIESLNELINFE